MQTLCYDESTVLHAIDAGVLGQTSGAAADFWRSVAVIVDDNRHCTVISTLVVGFEHNKIGVFLMYESMDTCHCEALVNEVSPLLWTKARATSCFKAFPIYSFAVSF